MIVYYREILLLLYLYVCYVYGPINVRLHGEGGHVGGYGGGHLIDFSLLTIRNFILWWENFALKRTNFEKALIMHGLIPAVTTLPSNTQNLQRNTIYFGQNILNSE